MRQFGHDRVSTFGIGSEHTQTEWRTIFRQLIALGYLNTDLEYGALKLTAKSRPVLKGEVSLQLRKERKPEKKSKRNRGEKETVRFVDQPLWEALKQVRLRLAQDQGVPPYVIFHDSTLMHMIKARPQNFGEMAAISGVGAQKLERYGQAFLDEVLQHPRDELLDNNLSDTVNETLRLFASGLSAEEISQQRELRVTTIAAHLADAVELGLLDVLAVTGLDKPAFDYIVNSYEMLPEGDKERLKPLYDALEGEYDYGVLRCVLATL